MAGGKETPRQRMIGILYLVLLGLIALSVNDSILDSFDNLTLSLDSSSGNIQKNTKDVYSDFEKTKLKQQAQRAQPIFERAQNARKYAKKLNALIEKFKSDMIGVDGRDSKTKQIIKRSSLDISPNYMINQNHAKELRKLIEETKKGLLSQLSFDARKSFTLNLKVEDSKSGSKSWEQANFGDGIPLTAAITNLAKIEADLINDESSVIKSILSEMDMSVVNLDKFAAVAVAPSSYLIQGQTYKAEVYLTAYDSQLKPVITVGGSSLPISADGKGLYTVNTSKEGFFKWSAIINVKQTDGSIKPYQTPLQEYQVARPSAVVSPDKMNVFYIGVPNPVSISAPGIPKEKLRVSINSGNISGADGKYIVLVNNSNPVSVRVSAEINGKIQPIGSSNFRVKRIPDPKAFFGGKSGGNLSAPAIRTQNFLTAVLEDFDFDAKFNVTRFTLTIAKPGVNTIILQGSGNTISGNLKSAMNTVSPGTKVIFDNIIAVGPDGSQRGLAAIVLTAN